MTTSWLVPTSLGEPMHLTCHMPPLVSALVWTEGPTSLLQGGGPRRFALDWQREHPGQKHTNAEKGNGRPLAPATRYHRRRRETLAAVRSDYPSSSAHQPWPPCLSVFVRKSRSCACCQPHPATPNTKTAATWIDGDMGID